MRALIDKEYLSVIVWDTCVILADLLKRATVISLTQMGDFYKCLKSLWIIAVLVSVYNCSFPLKYGDSILPTGSRSLQTHG